MVLSPPEQLAHPQLDPVTGDPLVPRLPLGCAQELSPRVLDSGIRCLRSLLHFAVVHLLKLSKNSRTEYIGTEKNDSQTQNIERGLVHINSNHTFHNIHTIIQTRAG